MNVHADELERLVEQGILVTRDGEFGEVLFAVQLTRLKLKASFKLTLPTLDLLNPRRAGAISKLSKMEILVHLIQLGWVKADGLLADGYAPGDALRLPLTCLDRPKSYLEALVLKDKIFAKKGDLPEILHRMTDSYYKCLLRLDDLSCISGLLHLEALTDDDYKEFLGTQPLEVEDKKVIKKRAAQRAAAIKFGDGGGRHVVDPRALLDKVPLPPIKIQIPELDVPVSVSFDNYSHDSGERRAFCY